MRSEASYSIWVRCHFVTHCLAKMQCAICILVETSSSLYVDIIRSLLILSAVFQVAATKTIRDTS